MLDTLLESSAVAPRRRLSSLVSLALHLGAAAALVTATAGTGAARDPEPTDTIVYIDAAPPPKPLPPSATPPASGAPSAPSALPQPLTPALAAPDLIPLTIPDIDLTRAVTREGDFTARPAPGGDGTTGSTPGFGIGEEAWPAHRVEKAVAMHPDSPPPSYPGTLRARMVEGEVRVRFVVDSSGRVDLARVTIVHTDHALFTHAVETALPRLRYRPAEVGGRPVAQLVEQSFTFRIDR